VRAFAICASEGIRGTAKAIFFGISVALFTMHGQMAMAQSDDVALCTQAGADALAIAACRRVVQSDASAQDKSRAHNRIGLSLGKTEIDKAIDHYKQALALNPNNVDALLNLGMIQFNRSDLRGAIFAASAALEIGVSPFGRMVALCLRARPRAAR